VSAEPRDRANQATWRAAGTLSATSQPPAQPRNPSPLKVGAGRAGGWKDWET
jgi:hypothetical protein